MAAVSLEKAPFATDAPRLSHLSPKAPKSGGETEIARGESYSVLRIMRRDAHEVRDWRHLQCIKNEIAGAECEGFEIFPAESRLVDTVNTPHLFVLPEGERIDVGSDERLVADEHEVLHEGGVIARPARLAAWDVHGARRAVNESGHDPGVLQERPPGT
jgi:hypothetical protein